MEEQLILVDKNDQVIRYCNKLEAHQKGWLHRAVSVFLFNEKGELLLQQRAHHKYHSAGLWSNTACSHPRPLENSKKAAERRLKEEMNIEAKLFFGFSFRYKTQFENRLIENELDHVFIGFSSELPKPNPDEAFDFKYLNQGQIEQAIQTNPDNFTYWFKIAYGKAFSIATQIAQDELV